MALAAVAREWDARVELSRIQRRRVFLDEGRSDPWDGLVSSFKPPPEGDPDDPVIVYLRSALRPDSVLLDVGAGAGRLAVPASRLCERVIAVEPSPAMSAELRHQIELRGIDNISVNSVWWEEADQEPVDLVLMSHVLYGVAPITPFVERAVGAARDGVVAVLGLSPPGGYYHPLWPLVHGESRVAAPDAQEFKKLLASWGHDPEIIGLPGLQAKSFRDRDEAIARSARRLRVRSGSPAGGRLEKAVDMALVESEDGTCHFRWRKPAASLLFHWPRSEGRR